MCERKIWKQQEDEILKEIFEQRKIKKWSQIAKIMEVQYGIQDRNGKQCRQRYHNHLKGGINKDKWTLTEENDLIHLHAEHGNKWALISKLIPGRSQNCIKNMLYSRMRKSIRLLNRFILENYKNSIKEIKIAFIYRLIHFTEKSYKKTSGARNEQENISIRLKNDLLMIQYDEDTISAEEKEKIKALIDDIHLFKRVNQRYRDSGTSKKATKTKDKKIALQKIVSSQSSCDIVLPKEEAHSHKENSNELTDVVEEKQALFHTDSILEQQQLAQKAANLQAPQMNTDFLHNKRYSLDKPILMEQIKYEEKEEMDPEPKIEEQQSLFNWQTYIGPFY